MTSLVIVQKVTFTDSADFFAGPWNTTSMLLPSGIEHERAVVARMVLALAGRAVVLAARGQCRSVESLHRFAVLALEGNVHAAGQLAERRVTLPGRDEQFIRPDVVVGFAAQRNLQHLEDRLVEAFAGLDILDHELDVIDESTAM